jgi:hypothetical protein
MLEFLRKFLRNSENSKVFTIYRLSGFDGPEMATILSAQLESTLRSNVPRAGSSDHLVNFSLVHETRAAGECSPIRHTPVQETAAPCELKERNRGGV